MELAMQSNTPHIAAMKKQYGEQNMIGYVSLWLIDLNKYVNAARKMTAPQVLMCASLIVDEFYHLTIADMNLIFKKAKMGEYGSLFETMSMDKVLTWFRDYMDQRNNLAANWSMRRHDKEKYNDEKIFNSRSSDSEIDKYKEAMTEHLKSLSKNS